VRWKSKIAKVRDKVKKLEEWKPHFLWLPVRIKEETVWLETVYRRGVCRGYDSSRMRAWRSVRRNLSADSPHLTSTYCWPIIDWEYRLDDFDMIKRPSNDG